MLRSVVSRLALGRGAVHTRASITLVLAIAAGPQCRAGGAGGSGAAEPLAMATVHLEQNATDGDIEVVFEVKGGADGLVSLAIVDPNGHTVAAFAAPGTLGMRQFRFETPEPTDTARLLAAYPEGAYSLTAATAAGERYSGTATVSHRLPRPATVVSPADGAENVAVDGFRVEWEPLPDVAGYTVAIEQDELGFSLSVTLPAGISALAVPDGVLEPGREYQLAIGTRTHGGNMSFVETSFVTAGKE